MPRILIPMSAQSAIAETLDYAVQIAGSLDSEVVVLSVSPGLATLPCESTLRTFEQAAKDYEVELDVQYANGDLLEKTVEFAEENGFDLIIMGASHASFASHYFGLDIHNKASIPILLIPFSMQEENCV